MPPASRGGPADRVDEGACTSLAPDCRRAAVRVLFSPRAPQGALARAAVTYHTLWLHQQKCIGPQAEAGGPGSGVGSLCGAPLQLPAAPRLAAGSPQSPPRRSPCAPASTPLLSKDSDHVHWGLPASTMTRSRPRPQRACSHRRPLPRAPGLGLQQGKAAFPGHDSVRSSG